MLVCLQKGCNMSIALDQLGNRLGVVVVEAKRTGKRRIDRVCAGDRVSDLLNQASDTTLIVTNLANASVARLIELMDVPAVCLLNAVQPDTALVETATEHGAAIIVSPDDMFQTCGKLHRILEETSAP